MELDEKQEWEMAKKATPHFLVTLSDLWLLSCSELDKNVESEKEKSDHVVDFFIPGLREAWKAEIQPL